MYICIKNNWIKITPDYLCCDMKQSKSTYLNVTELGHFLIQINTETFYLVHILRNNKENENGNFTQNALSSKEPPPPYLS